MRFSANQLMGNSQEREPEAKIELTMIFLNRGTDLKDHKTY